MPPTTASTTTGRTPCSAGRGATRGSWTCEAWYPRGWAEPAVAHRWAQPTLQDIAVPRSEWTSLTDAQLLAQCAVDTYRASGPGGQKRNKTSSAVRIRHSPTGLIVIAEESRSQHENKAKAIKRLRRALYLELRDA